MPSEAKRGLRKVREGTVVSATMDKTRVVRVYRLVQHPVYKKVLKKSKSYYVHDEGNETNVGDKVRIVETRPLSKLKRWRMLEVLRTADTSAKSSVA